MKSNLKNYLGSLFAGAPRNSANDALFEELYGNLCDRYDELIGKGLAEDEAYARAIGEVGDIRPLIDWRGSYRAAHTQHQGEFRAEGAGAQRAPFYSPAKEKKNDSKKQRLASEALRRAKWTRAWALSIAVMLYILWLVPTILWGSVSALFVCVAVGTVILVLSRTRTPSFLDDSQITYDRETRAADERASDLLNAFGIACCILCVLPAAIIEYDWGAALMFAIVSVGVGMILLAAGIRPKAPKGIEREAYAAQTQKDFAEPPEKRRNRWLLPVILVAVVAVLTCGIWLCVRHDFEFGFYTDDDSFTSYTEVGGGTVTQDFDSLSVYWYAGNVSIKAYDGEAIQITETYADGTALDKDEQVHWGIHAGNSPSAITSLNDSAFIGESIPRRI